MKSSLGQLVSIVVSCSGRHWKDVIPGKMDNVPPTSFAFTKLNDIHPDYWSLVMLSPQLCFYLEPSIGPFSKASVISRLLGRPVKGELRPIKIRIAGFI